MTILTIICLCEFLLLNFNCTSFTQRELRFERTFKHSSKLLERILVQLRNTFIYKNYFSSSHRLQLQFVMIFLINGSNNSLELWSRWKPAKPSETLKVPGSKNRPDRALQKPKNRRCTGPGREQNTVERKTRNNREGSVDGEQRKKDRFRKNRALIIGDRHPETARTTGSVYGGPG